jgi:hypothetical protein
VATEPRVTPIAGRYANKPGKFLVRSVMAVRELSDAELETIPGFVRKTTEGIVFDNKSNAKKFVKSDLLKNVKAAAIKSRADASGIARQKKSANPQLFNKIIQLAEEGKTSVAKIGTNPEVIKLNKGRPITYTNIKNIITREKGKNFFNKVAETKQYRQSPLMADINKNLKNIMKDYYAGIGTQKLTKKYLPNSTAAQSNQSSTILENVVKKNIDPKKLANRPAAIGANQFGTRKEQIKVLKNFQNYLSKNTKKFTSKAIAESNLKDLFKGSDSGTIGNFVARTNILRKAYNSKTLPEGFKVNQKVKDLIQNLPAQDFVESELRALGFSEKTIKSMNQVETAVQKMTNASTQLEHALPRSIIRALDLPKKYYLTAERTTNFLNKFKMQFDAQMKNAAMTYAESNQTPSDYKKYISKVDKIRNKVRKLTGGYEIGYVDFDKAGNAIPITSQDSILRKGDAESIKAKGIENFKKNLQYHNNLFKNFSKNPESADFFTLREEISESPRPFVEEFIQKVKSIPGGCRAVVTAALGGPIDKCEAIIKADPKAAAIKLNNTITATKGPLKELKEESIKLSNFIDSGQITTADKLPRPDDAVLKDTFKETNLRWNNDIGAFITGNEDDIASQSDIKKYAADNPMEVKVGEEPLKAATNKSVLANVGKAMARVGAPLPVAAIDSYFIGQQVKEGKGTAEIASNPLNWLGLATMEPLAKASGIAEGGGLNKALRLGLNPATIRGITRFAGLPGLAVSTAMTAYDQYQKYKDGEGFIFNLLNQKGTE